MLDYAEEVTKGLCIVKKTGKKPVNAGVKKSFKKKYKEYVERRLSEVTQELPVTIIFQATQVALARRNQKQDIDFKEDNLKEVVKTLPRLPLNENYQFPILKVEITEYGRKFSLI